VEWWRWPRRWPADGRDERSALDRMAAGAGAEIDAMMVIAPPRSPGALASAPVVHGIPVGLVPADRISALKPWLEALHPRTRRGSEARGRRLWAVLAEWEDRYLRRARVFAARLAESARRRRVVRRWLADRLNGDAVLARLDCAPRWVNYFGHASEGGLAGYFGITAADFLQRPSATPMSVFWCWACRTLGRTRAGTAFGTRLVCAGRVAAFVGSIHAVKTEANERLSALAAGLMARSPRTVGELMRDLDRTVATCGDPRLTRAWRSYRLVGNPFELL
jgi:hypothetical protein